MLGVRQSPEKGKGVRRGLGGPIRYDDFRVDQTGDTGYPPSLGLKGRTRLIRSSMYVA
ncbi:MAG: hypothetical protein ACKOAH_19350 [Pirellula sp.]